jgi:uncharacterized membrane protein
MIATALMATLCYVIAMYWRIELGGGIRFHLGPTPLMLAGILFGPLSGGFAGAVGFPLMNITAGTVVHAPAQFIMRFAQGFLCGLIAWGSIKGGNAPKPMRIIVASAASAAVYFALFMVYSYFIDIPYILGLTSDAVWVEMARRIPNSTAMAISNAAAAAILAPPLRTAMQRAGLRFTR